MRVIHVRVMASDYHFDPGSAYLYCCSFFGLLPPKYLLCKIWRRSRPARHVTLTDAEDSALRDLEQVSGIHPKVRLRSSVLRLNAQGWTIPRLARHFARSSAAIHHDLNRYEQHSLRGLGDDAAPGNPAMVTLEMQSFLHTKLAEDRIWNCTLLGEALHEQFGIHPRREAIRLSLLTLAYT